MQRKGLPDLSPVSGSPALPLYTPITWMDHALCKDYDPELFFEPHKERRAVQVCAACPVRERCLKFGLEEAWGVWGGYAATERNLIRRRMGVRRQRNSWGHPSDH